MKSRILVLLAGCLIAAFSQSIKADVLDAWTTNQLTTNSFGFHHVAYGNGIYVAVGEWSDSGGFYASADGFNWSLQYSEPNSWGVSLTYSEGRFASVTPRLDFKAVDVSADGTNWTTSNFAGAASGFRPAAITYGNGVYVVVGSTNNVASIMTSPDGVTWTYRQASTAPGGPINGVAYSFRRFVAIGNNDGYVYVSSGISAGTNWSRDSGAPFFTTITIPGGNQISCANNRFFVPLNNKTNLLSADGINWSQKATGLTNTLGTVTYSHGLYLAQSGISSSGSYLASSSDGTNWFQYSKLLPNSCAIYDTSDFDVSVATDGTRLITGSSSMGSSFTGFNSFVYASAPLAGIRQTNGNPMKVAISGLVGGIYQIQSTDALGAGSNWRTNLTLQLTNTPFVWTDSTATNSARFYRAVWSP
jgi:hypothetical protein